MLCLEWCDYDESAIVMVADTHQEVLDALRATYPDSGIQVVEYGTPPHPYVRVSSRDSSRDFRLVELISGRLYMGGEDDPRAEYPSKLEALRLELE